MGKKVEVIEYEDLTGQMFDVYEVLSKYSPLKFTPETLNESHWTCKCTLCGAEKRIKGNVLKSKLYKNCVCQQKEDDEVDVRVGLYNLMENDKEAFHDYLKRRREEDRIRKGHISGLDVKRNEKLS